MISCLKCGTKFIPCSTCSSTKKFYGWKKDFCKPECFQEYMKQIEGEKEMVKKVNGNSIRGKIRGKLYDEDKMSDILDYQFDEIKGSFIDNYNISRNIYDYQYLYITHDILEDIFQEIFQLGINFEKNKNKSKKQQK